MPEVLVWALFQAVLKKAWSSFEVACFQCSYCAPVVLITTLFGMIRALGTVLVSESRLCAGLSGGGRNSTSSGRTTSLPGSVTFPQDAILASSPSSAAALFTSDGKGGGYCVWPVSMRSARSFPSGDVVHIVLLSQLVVLLHHCFEVDVLEKLLSEFHAVSHASQSPG